MNPADEATIAILARLSTAIMALRSAADAAEPCRDPMLLTELLDSLAHAEIAKAQCETRLGLRR